MTDVKGPGAGRLTVVGLAIVTAVLAYPWRSITDRWALGIAVAVVLVSLSWWRGHFLTTLLWRRVRVPLSRRPIEVTSADILGTGTDAVTTALLRVDSRPGELPLGLLTGYLDRYGVVCDAVRVTTRATPDSTTTWIGLTFSGTRNLAALQGRSPQIPLRQTAQNAARRLAGHLQETGWTTALVDADDVPAIAGTDARERWRSVADSRGHLTTYTVVDPETALAAVSAAAAQEVWTVVEIAGPSPLTDLKAGVAIRTEGPPADSAPAPGLTRISGRQASALAALHPLSGMRLV
ncbi:type VII secretion protein EccE [Mycolicibacterium rhodesiae]|uniref:Type VII secretion protein EccE n=1 Tax=Mycolicibacterium rhodesiae TaxID=36814 RepID=A0A1X0J1D7_MYCRH|nr:type VII secretion protein EccE [Mycolicibacterium rhodesiae]MCV7344892.1 type VII secretion protein EccE [Mycolicibacterium rhodesiae]ORB55661.1 type VII secretion protein EccE [Mycolicibacterium rhodesiae]